MGLVGQLRRAEDDLARLFPDPSKHEGKLGLFKQAANRIERLEAALDGILQWSVSHKDALDRARNALNHIDRA